MNLPASQHLRTDTFSRAVGTRSSGERKQATSEQSIEYHYDNHKACSCVNWSYHKEWAHKNPLAPLHCIRAIQYVIRDYTDKTLGSMYSKTFPATNLLPGLRLSITWMRKNSENNGGLYTIAWAGPTLCLRMASSTGQFTVGYMKITNRWNLMVQKRPKSKKHLIWLNWNCLTISPNF